MSRKGAKTEADVKARICKASVTFLQLKNIWKSKSFRENQDQDFQYKYEDFSFLEQIHRELQWPPQEGYRPLLTAI